MHFILVMLLPTSKRLKVGTFMAFVHFAEKCAWIRNNHNSDGEVYAGKVKAIDDCIDLVRSLDECSSATIANVRDVWDDNEDGRECYCQYGSDMRYGDTYFISCLLSTIGDYRGRSNSDEKNGIYSVHRFLRTMLFTNFAIYEPVQSVPSEILSR